MQNLIFTYHLPITLEQGLSYVSALERVILPEAFLSNRARWSC